MNEIFHTDDFTIIFNPQIAHVDLEVYEVAGTQGETKLYVDAAGEFVETTEEARPYIKGSIKWDGCSNLYLGEEGYFHFCGKASAMKLGELIELLYDKCAVYLEVKERGNEDLYGL